VVHHEWGLNRIINPLVVAALAINLCVTLISCGSGNPGNPDSGVSANQQNLIPALGGPSNGVYAGIWGTVKER